MIKTEGSELYHQQNLIIMCLGEHVIVVIYISFLYILFVTNCFLLNALIGLPTCLLCTCLGTTVYCDDHELDAVPPLPKKTTYFYSRYNRIRKINRNDFANLSMDSSIVAISFNFYYFWLILI